MDNVFTIIGIDPGNNLGIGILHIDVTTMSIVAVESRTYILDKLVDDNSYNRLLDRCNNLFNIVKNLNYEYRPIVLGLEAAFMNSRFPKSVIQLSQYVGTIEIATQLNNYWCKILKYPPKYIKSMCGAGGSADKDAMKKNLLLIPEIANTIDVNNLTEHAIDSLSIAYVVYKYILENPYILYTLP